MSGVFACTVTASTSRRRPRSSVLAYAGDVVGVGVKVSLPPNVSEEEARAWLAQLSFASRWGLFLPIGKARRIAAKIASEGRFMPRIGTSEVDGMDGLVAAIQKRDPEMDKMRAIALAAVLATRR